MLMMRKAGKVLMKKTKVTEEYPKQIYSDEDYEINGITEEEKQAIEDLESGRVKPKVYNSVKEMMDEVRAEHSLL